MHLNRYWLLSHSGVSHVFIIFALALAARKGSEENALV